MKEYEISLNDKNVGRVKIFKDNLNKNIKNSLLISNKEFRYKIMESHDHLKEYIVSFIVNDIDDIYSIVSKYTYNDKIFDVIDEIKKYNKIKNIKKNTLINIIISEIHLNILNINKNNIDKESLLKSKIHFITKVCEDLKIQNKSNFIIDSYNKYKNSTEFEFLTNKEKEKEILKFINESDKIIKNIEKNNDYKYGKDYIIPIKINNLNVD